MKISVWLSFILLISFLVACGGPADQPTPSPQATATLSQPGINTTQAPDVKETVRAYLDAWENEDYAAMYQLLTPFSRDAITTEEFESSTSLSIQKPESLINFSYLCPLTY